VLAGASQYYLPNQTAVTAPSPPPFLPDEHPPIPAVCSAAPRSFLTAIYKRPL
jgi:hypothetical protein